MTSMKIVINALKHWTNNRITDVVSRIVQPNLSQKDPAQPDYVKGVIRQESLPEGYPYIGEPVEIMLVDNLTKDDYQNGSYPNCTFIEGATYKIIWNGIAYDNLICVCDGEYNVIQSGDGELPIYLDDDGGNGLYIDSDDSDWTISIYRMAQGIHKLFAEYLPDGYPYKKETEILAPIKTEIINNKGYTSVFVPFSRSLVDGKRYIVRLGSEEYECICTRDLNQDFMILGNPRLANTWNTDNGLHFCLYNTEDNLYTMKVNGDVWVDGVYVLSVVYVDVHTINEEFIPEIPEEKLPDTIVSLKETTVKRDVLITEKREEIIPETQLDFYLAQYTGYAHDFGIEYLNILDEGEEYIVTLDGIEHRLVAWNDTSWGSDEQNGVVLGEGAVIMSEPGESEFSIGNCLMSFYIRINSNDKYEIFKLEKVNSDIKEKFIPDSIARVEDIPDAVTTPATAAVGQTLVVKSVNDEGKPTEWQAVDMPSDEHINSLVSGQVNTVMDGYATEEFVGKKVSEAIADSVVVDSDDIYGFFIESDRLLTLTAKDSGDINAKIEIRRNNDEPIHCYANMKVQGSSSSSYDKKNYTIKFYTDERCSKKLKLDVGWGKQSKYCFKANYVDTMHIRNITGAKLTYDMVESRPDSDFKTALQLAPRNGAIDGFPVKVYLNGEFHGLYTWNIPKDGWMFGMDEDNPNNIVLAGAFNNNQDMTAANTVQFRAEWAGESDESWSVEFGEITDEVVASLNRCINFFMTATDQELHDNISDYMDLYSLLDYYIFSDFCVHLDGLGNNMLISTYDGVHWGTCLYDMDTIFGAWWNGQEFVATDYVCPDDYQENNSLLWQRVVQCFPAELKARYFELRNRALSLGNIITHAENLYNKIPDRVFTDEQEKWTSLPSVDTNTMTRLRNYMRDRATVIDAKYNAITYDAPCTYAEITSESLVFTGEDFQTVEYTVTPTYTSDVVKWSVTPAGLCDVINGNTVVPLKNGSGVLTMTCGNKTASCPISISGINDVLTYIQSDGTQYVDTGYVPNYRTVAEISCNLAWSNHAFAHFLGSDNMFKMQWGSDNTEIAVYKQGLNYTAPVTDYVGADVIFRYDNAITAPVTINGADVELTDKAFGTQATTTDHTMLIFSGRATDGTEEGENYREHFKLYSLKIEECGEVIHYFVPKLDDSNVPCLYDMIEQVYYYNENTSGNTFGYA